MTDAEDAGLLAELVRLHRESACGDVPPVDAEFFHPLLDDRNRIAKRARGRRLLEDPPEPEEREAS